MKRKLLSFLVLCVVLLSAAAALAEGDIYVGGPWGTRITKLPYTISTPGAYYLGGNLSTASGDGITIASDHVTLDLMGFNLNGPGTGTGIFMEGRTNVEIRNGTITNWHTGIWDSGAGICHRILNVRLSGCNYGMTLNGNGHLVKGCEARGNPGVRGLWIAGVGAISDCRASNFNYEGIGLGFGGIMRGNVVTGNAAATSQGLVLYSSGQCLMIGNEVTNCAHGLHIGSATSAINNTVTTASTNGIAGIYGNNDGATVLDQNTVMGPGTHTFHIDGANTRITGNAGFPP